MSRTGLSTRRPQPFHHGHRPGIPGGQPQITTAHRHLSIVPSKCISNTTVPLGTSRQIPSSPHSHTSLSRPGYTSIRSKGDAVKPQTPSPTMADGIKSRFLTIKEKISVAIERVSMNPSTEQEKKAYTRMVHSHEQRYAVGEAEAARAHRKKVWQDDIDGGVFHVPPGIDPEQFRKIDSPTIKVKVNEDGSYSFTTDDGDEARTKPHTAPEGEKLTEDVQKLRQGLEQEDSKPAGAEIGQFDDPRLLIGFTCDVCETRSVKSMPKRSYEHGVVLIRCDGCLTDHLIADHLGWFDDDGGGITIEKIMKEKGETVIKATVDGVTGVDGQLPPEVIEKVQQTLATAREQDLKQPIGGKFKHLEEQVDVGGEQPKIAPKH